MFHNFFIEFVVNTYVLLRFQFQKNMLLTFKKISIIKSFLFSFIITEALSAINEVYYTSMIAGLKLLEIVFSLGVLILTIILNNQTVVPFQYFSPAFCSILDGFQLIFLKKHSNIEIISRNHSDKLDLTSLVVVGFTSYFEFLLFLAGFLLYDDYILKVLNGVKSFQTGLTVIYSAL